jgi:Uncharacterized protein conserved in bacteria
MNTPTKGERYQHYKGGEYEIIDTAVHTESKEEVVVYRSLTYGTTWVRPLAVFNDWVKVQGVQVPRFQKKAG